MREYFSTEQKTFLRISNKSAKISNKCFTSMAAQCSVTVLCNLLYNNVNKV